MSNPDPATFAVLVPVKRTAHAKTRLGGLGDEARSELAAAFATDTVSAVLQCPEVARVLVVSDDHVLARSLHDLGAEVVPDGTADLNGTLVQAAAEMHRRAPDLRLAAVCSDLPCLRPPDLSSALAAADPSRLSFVADAERLGTTAVVAPDVGAFLPRFGAGSRAAHLAAGAFEIDAVAVPTLRRDIDDPADLATALELGVGPRTSRVAAGLLR